MKFALSRFFSTAILFLLLVLRAGAAAPQPDSLGYAPSRPLAAERRLAQLSRALRQTRTQLYEAQASRRRAWLGVAALAGGLGVALGLAWWASRQRRRAARQAQLHTHLTADLHEEVGTLLARVSMQAELLHQQQPEPSPALARLLGNSHAAARTMRDLVWSADEQAATVGALLDRIRDYLDHSATPAGVRAQLRVNGLADSTPLPAGLRQHLYLLVKEAVANSLRHAAQATTLTVTLTHYAVARDLVLSIEDDGQPAASPARTGLGLRTMQQRAQALGGTLEAGPRRESGFRVQLQVPFGY